MGLLRAVANALTNTVETIRNFFRGIYQKCGRFFTVRSRLLKQLRRVECRVDDLIEDRNDLQRRLDNQDIIPILKTGAQNLVAKITRVKDVAERLHAEFERKWMMQLYYNEDDYTDQIDEVEDRVDNVSSEVKIFLKLYANAAEDMIA